MVEKQIIEQLCFTKELVDEKVNFPQVSTTAKQ
jgi:hypothetical protein